MNPFGLSNGCAEFALKMPPPLVPSSLIASCEAVAPVYSEPELPVSVWTVARWLESSCGTPVAIRMMPNTIENGSISRRISRVRSTQKLPTRSVLVRMKPRIRVATTAMPTAAETKFCTASPANCAV